MVGVLVNGKKLKVIDENMKNYRCSISFSFMVGVCLGIWQPFLIIGSSSVNHYMTSLLINLRNAVYSLTVFLAIALYIRIKRHSIDTLIFFVHYELSTAGRKKSNDIVHYNYCLSLFLLIIAFEGDVNNSLCQYQGILKLLQNLLYSLRHSVQISRSIECSLELKRKSKAFITGVSNRKTVYKVNKNRPCQIYN